MMSFGLACFCFDRPPTSTPDNRTPDERCTSSFPTRLRDLEIGWRLDALDGQGGWFAATVVEVRQCRLHMLVYYTTVLKCRPRLILDVFCQKP